MSSQYAQRKIMFEKRWNAVCIQYEEAESDQGGIEYLSIFDCQWARSCRIYINSLPEPEDTTLTGLGNVALLQESMFQDRNDINWLQSMMHVAAANQKERTAV